MVNNAGLGGTAQRPRDDRREWAQVLDVTLTGTFRCTRAALRQMVAQGGGGVIVNNASVLGWRAQAGQAHYAAAKAGVMALTRCAALDVAAHGIRVNAVAPSLAMHPFLAKVTSEELLAELAAARGVRPRRRAVGGGQRDGLPGQRLLLLPDRRGRLREQPACLSPPPTAAPSCSGSPPRLFAEKGFKNTTVRDIADAAGILSGSLYHHFDSKEAMVDELLDSFQTALWEEYDASRPPTGPRGRSSRRSSGPPSRRSTSTTARSRSSRPTRRTSPRSSGSATSRSATSASRPCGPACCRDGVAAGELRADLDVDSSTASCATPSGWRCGGTAPAASCRRPRSPTSTSRSSWRGSPDE